MSFGKMGARSMMHSGLVLPTGARWVEYLESTGTQWIDTGVPVYDTTGFLIKADTTTNTTMNSAICAVFPTSIGDSRFGIAFNSKNTCFTWWNIAVDANIALPSDKTYQCNFKNSRTISLGNYEFDITNTLNSNGTTATLFACNRGGGSLLFNGYVRIGSAQLSDGADIVHDFRPIAIGTTGYMLDLVSGEYLPYGNKGTGDFVIGPDISAPQLVGGGGNLLVITLYLTKSSTYEAENVSSWKEAA